MATKRVYREVFGIVTALLSIYLLEELPVFWLHYAAFELVESLPVFWYCRLEQEEQARQKLQLEKVTADTKLKKFEEEIAQHETLTAKV